MWNFIKRNLPFQRTEQRSSGYTADVIQARGAYITGARGIAQLTATTQGAVSLWENGFAIADIAGTDMLNRQTLALTGRSLALRGEALFLIRDGRLMPISEYDVTTRNAVPTAYRVSVPDTGGGRTLTALAGEILHIRIGADPSLPYHGVSPLRRSSLTAGLLHAVETALTDVFADAPIGSQIVPMPESEASDTSALRRSFVGARGRVLVVEGVAPAVAAGMHPQANKSPDSLTPDLSKLMSRETLAAARNSILMAFGLLPGIADANTTGPMVREAQRHLAQWTLQPVALLLAEEASNKLGAQITVDLMRPLQAFDAGLRARSVKSLIDALAQAKEAGVDPSDAFKLVDWGQSE
ncbi:MAG: phage portal protein [Pseudomonadota bacterium]